MPTSASRNYKVFGKVDLDDSIWLEVNGNAVLARKKAKLEELKRTAKHLSHDGFLPCVVGQLVEA